MIFLENNTSYHNMNCDATTVRINFRILQLGRNLFCDIIEYPNHMCRWCE